MTIDYKTISTSKLLRLAVSHFDDEAATEFDRRFPAATEPSDHAAWIRSLKAGDEVEVSTLHHWEPMRFRRLDEDGDLRVVCSSGVEKYALPAEVRPLLRAAPAVSVKAKHWDCDAADKRHDDAVRMRNDTISELRETIAAKDTELAKLRADSATLAVLSKIRDEVQTSIVGLGFALPNGSLTHAPAALRGEVEKLRRDLEDARKRLARTAAVETEARRRRDIHEAAETKWGTADRVDKAIEELGELIVALTHHRSARASQDEVVTEIADVQIMCESLRLIFGEVSVDAERARKLERLAERLQGTPEAAHG